MKKIVLASDHAGYSLKEYLKNFLNKKKVKFTDVGANSKKNVDYPDYAHKLSKKVASNSRNLGILICGSGMGMAISANKNKKIRAALCYSIKSTKLSRLHNNANIITLGARLINKNKALNLIRVFLKTKFEGGRHLRRVKKI